MRFMRWSIPFIVILCIHYPQTSVCDSTVVSCCDWRIGEYRLHLVPDPTSCLVFHQCRPFLMEDGRYGTTPTLQFCPLDENGNRQHYDFRECKCLRSDEAICFDHTVPGHSGGFFNCTVPFVDNGMNSKC